MIILEDFGFRISMHDVERISEEFFLALRGFNQYQNCQKDELFHESLEIYFCKDSRSVSPFEGSLRDMALKQMKIGVQRKKRERKSRLRRKMQAGKGI
jgi:hypothetical protein